MYTPPPQDDETIDQMPKHASPRHDKIAGPRYRPARTYSSSRSYYSDEHPEVPRVRRASLAIDEVDMEIQAHRKNNRALKNTPLPSTDKMQRVGRTSRRSPSSMPGERAEHAASSSMHRHQRLRDSDPAISAYRKAPRARVHEDAFFETLAEDTEHTRAVPHTANRIMVSQRRRSTLSTVYEPPTGSATYRARPRSATQQDHLFTYLERLGRNRKLMLGLSVAFILLLVSPMVMNSLINRPHPVTMIPSGSDSTVSIGAAPAGPSTSQKSTSNGLTVVPIDTSHPAPPVFATSAYLLDADTGATLYAHNPFMHLPMLSTTKLMTALLAAEKGNPDQKITINGTISNDVNHLSADSSVMGIKKGETYTLRELLYGMFLMSGNDAATAVADAIGGNLPTFVGMMNQRASQLGLHDTHYMNPHGLLEDGHYSSAHDLAVLGNVVMHNTLLHQISGTRSYTLPKTAQHAQHVMFNGNQFLWWYPGADGGKPGWDGDVNFIQVVSVTRNNHHLIGVTMHTKDWWTDMRDLMNWGFDSFQWVSPHDSDLISRIPYDADWDYFNRDTKTITIPTADSGRYYIFTGYSISGIILRYFDKNGGLPKFGYPRGLPSATETTLVSQRFDHGTLQCNTANNQCRLTA